MLMNTIGPKPSTLKVYLVLAFTWYIVARVYSTVSSYTIEVELGYKHKVLGVNNV